ncbi:MAG: hypothetical protein NTZ82_06085 [Bacteroidetes bacterium]|nr:hypothetical protein [Bacteroidota bacterium]
MSLQNHDKKIIKSTANWSKYAGLGTQLITGLLLLLYIGKKTDAYFQYKNRFTWILPSLFIFYTLARIIKETQPKK